jgi:hypothetical protein
LFFCGIHLAPRPSGHLPCPACRRASSKKPAGRRFFFGMKMNKKIKYMEKQKNNPIYATKLQKTFFFPPSECQLAIQSIY